MTKEDFAGIVEGLVRNSYPEHSHPHTCISDIGGKKEPTAEEKEKRRFSKEGIEDCKESLTMALAHHPKDWASHHRDAWIWGIVIGWDEESLLEIQNKFGWYDETVARLKRLNTQFKEMKVGTL
jgi:hypothetical protein